MRRVASSVVVLGLAALAGCPLATGPSTGECDSDGDCAGNVCARDGLCYPSASVREIKTTWTIRGMPASTATCAGNADLAIAFSGGEAGEQIGFAPVPCENGQFFMDKIPRAYTFVELGRDGGFLDGKAIGTSGEVSFDLRF